MHRIFCTALLLTALVACQEGPKETTDQMTEHPIQNFLGHPSKVRLDYPATKTEMVRDTYFDVVVEDPYRWLEEPVSGDASPDLNQWVESQSKLARNYLDGIRYRNDIAKRLEKLYDYERETAPMKEGGQLYFYKNDGLQAHSVLYKKKTWDAPEEVFLDPNTFSKDGSVSLSGVNFSEDGRYAAYRISESGSDWGTVYVMDTKTGEKLKDKVEWLRYSGLSWYKEGFLYSRYGGNTDNDKFVEKNQFHQVYYHKVGTPQSEDQLIFADRAQPDRNFGAYATEDEEYWFLSVTESTSGNALYYKKATDTEAAFSKLVDNFDHDFYVVDNIEDQLLVYTNYKAAKYQLIRIDLSQPEEKNWVSVIPERKDATLNGVQHIGGKLFARYTKGITNELQAFDFTGKALGVVALPDIISKTAPVTISGITGKREDAEAYFSISSFVLPSTICKLNVNTLQATVWKQPKVDFDPRAYQIDYVQYPSKDGTMIPISIIYKKGLARNSTNPTLLYGYGGFNISILPRFALTRLPFLEKGGVYAVANIRGGGEMGQEWHEAGTQLNKQNVFDDFIAAAEYLMAEKYTSSDYLAIEGRSNGGLLVGACMTQRPELYKVAFPIVGVLDMMRYHTFTIGHFWAADYGRSDDKTQYKNLLGYSPVHNVKEIAYPATMVMTADHDDRVVPAHSFKFGAALQAKQQGKAPILLRIDRKAGHGAGKAVDKVIEEEADKLAFLFFNMNMTY